MNLIAVGVSKEEIYEKDAPLVSASGTWNFLCRLCDAAGAFGAHFLKNILDASILTVFDTATRYQMYHALGLCIVASAVDRYPEKGLEPSGWFFVVGILLFSGSLYGVSLTGIRWFGTVTPVGGVAFLIGWILLGYRVWRRK